MRDLVPYKLCAILSNPPEVRSDTLVTLAKLISSYCEREGRIGGLEIQTQFLNKDPFWNISHFLELGGVASLGRTKLAADFNCSLELGCLWFRLVLLRRLSQNVRRKQEQGDDTSDENEPAAKNRFESVWPDSHLLLLASKSSTPRVIRAVHLIMAIDTAAIYRPDVQRFSGGGRMTRQHVNMALLAQQMNASSQKLRIVRAMRRVTVRAILADRGMVPEKRPPFFGMTGVTRIIDGILPEHLPCLPTMRIVAGSAADLHVALLGAKQVRGALEQSLSDLLVAADAGFLYGEAG
jgi:hypothetical protein